VKRSYKYRTFILHKDAEYTCVATFNAYPGDPGNTSGPPERCYEATPPEMELLDVKVDGMDMLPLLTEDEKIALEERIWDNSEVWGGDRYE
jgi:hypothetical protein